ncbi:MAG: dehypoxanthine futalosine cyclase [Actinobacteria bacterium]|nr:dehypoxanthine futalosine cyclase [Actinomycetota bacterium]
MKFDDLARKIEKGKRITSEEAISLFREYPLSLLAKIANDIKEEKYGNKVTFIVDRNINYTNICEVRCKFCAFSRDEEDSDAYVLSEEEILNKVEEAVNMGATQVMLQGGLYRKTDLYYITNIFSLIKKRFPQISIHSLTATEIDYFSKIHNLSIEEVLTKLKESGLSSLPGGGAEILVDKVRKIISPKKISSSKWLQIHEKAHLLGLKSTATMVIGHRETIEDRILHLERIRKLQDKTGGFLSFIPWIYYPGKTELGGTKTTSVDYLRTLAVARIFMDNIPHVQASWLTVGKKTAQMALYFGADDLGSIMLEENVVRATGHNAVRMAIDEMVNLIKSADRKPAQRKTDFTIVREFN